MKITKKITEILLKPGVQKYTKNTLWLFFEQITRLLVNFFVGIWIVRYLGPEKYGIFSYSVAFVAIFSGVAKLGLDGIVVRELVKEPQKKDVYLGTAFWLKIIGAFISMSLIGLSMFIINNDKTINIYIFIISCGIIFQSFEVVDFYFQSKVLAKFVSICRLTQLTLSSILKIYFMIKNADLLYFVLVSLIDQITLAIALFLSYLHYHKKNENKSNCLYFLDFKLFDYQIAKNLLKNSYPLLLVLISSNIYSKVDQLMIKNMMDNYSVGVYSAAVKISDVLVTASPIFAYSFFPALINAKKNSNEEYYKRLIILYSFVFWFSFIIAIFISLFSSQIITLLYGNKYRDSHIVLSIYVFTTVFSYIGGISSRWYIIENLQSIFSIYLLLAAILNIILNYLLIPKYGIKGSALASLITFAFSAYFSNLMSKKTLNNFKIQMKAIYYPFKYLYEM